MCCWIFLRGEKCVKRCENGDIINIESSVCVKRTRCLVDNCEECLDDNSTVCKRCRNGLYLLNNQCREFCPRELRADRINWICQEPPIFAWYWIFPSESFYGKCGIVLNSCSCRDDCYMYGDCCQDVEDYCYKFLINK
jgi:hypothetical protein